MSASPRDGGPANDPEDPTGPGAQLREARHRANLSLEEVATQLRLDRRTVRALEENEFQYLPAPTFIRGYIRSYARLLGLPPGPILEAYDYQGFTPPAIMADITQRPQARFSDIPVRLATGVVAAGLVAMVVMWWHSREATPEMPSEVEFVAGASGNPASTGTSPQELTSAEQPPEPPAPPAEELITAESPSDGQSDSAAEPAPQAAITAPEATTTTQARTPTESVPPPTVTAELPRDSAGDTPPSPGASGTVTVREALITNMERPPAPPSRLVIRFSDESWVEIFDADGIRREFRLATPGSRSSVSGTPPFNVLLGYAEGASVSFDGRDYDISRYIRGDTARFLIGPDGLAKARPPERKPEPEESSAAAEPEASPLPAEAAAARPSVEPGPSDAN